MSIEGKSTFDYAVFEGYPGTLLDMREMIAEDVSFKQAKFIRADSTGADFASCDFDGADFTGTNLEGVTFKNKYTNYKNAAQKLQDNKYFPWETAKENSVTAVKPNTFKDCDLSGKSFAGSEISGCDFSGSNLERAEFNDALINGVKVSELYRSPEGKKMVEKILGEYQGTIIPLG